MTRTPVQYSLGSQAGAVVINHVSKHQDRCMWVEFSRSQPDSRVDLRGDPDSMVFWSTAVSFLIKKHSVFTYFTKQNNIHLFLWQQSMLDKLASCDKLS